VKPEILQEGDNNRRRDGDCGSLKSHSWRERLWLIRDTAVVSWLTAWTWRK